MDSPGAGGSAPARAPADFRPIRWSGHRGSRKWGGDGLPPRGVAQSGSVPALGAGGPGFESRRPDYDRLIGCGARCPGRGRRSGARSLSRLGSIVALLALAGCQTLGLDPEGGGPGRRAALVGGEYRGYLWVEGDPVPGALILTPRGSSVSARLASEAGVNGSGEGRLAGEELVVRIPYRTTCEGEIVLEGSVSSGGSRFVGNFTADDCTGSTSGRFDFRLP